MPKNMRMVRIRFSQYIHTPTIPGNHVATITLLPQYKRRVSEPFDSVDYTPEVRTEKVLGWQPDGRFIGKQILHRGRKP